MIRAVLFDLDNTLIDRDTALKLALNLEVGHGRKTDALIQLDDHGYGCRQTFLKQWSLTVGSDRTMQHLSNAICKQLEPDPSLISSLQQLQRYCAIGIITNGGAKNQMAKIRHAKLDQAVSSNTIWISADLPYSKPAAEIFHHASNHFRLPIESCLFIGDHPVNDIKGASQAGMQTIQVHNAVTASFVDKLQERCR